MRLDKPKTTIIVAAVLTVLCAGSFFGIRLVNANKTEQPVTISAFEQQNTAAAPAADADTSPSLETSNLAVDSQDDVLDTALFTTFPTDELTTDDAEEPTTADFNNIVTTTTAPYTTTLPTTTQPTTTTAAAAEDPEKVIQRAAVFSNGFLGYQYNSAGQYYYTVDDPWQRNFGFNELYDIGAPFVNFYYDTFRVKFTYKKMDWLIQFWKGQYGLVFLGGEIGCYYKPVDRETEHYDCVADEDMLYMSMSFYRNGVERVNREYAKYWWCTGFIPGTLKSFRDRSELSMKARLTMKDKTMLNLFCASLEKNGFKLDETYTVSGLDVYISWG